MPKASKMPLVESQKKFVIRSERIFFFLCAVLSFAVTAPLRSLFTEGIYRQETRSFTWNVLYGTWQDLSFIQTTEGFLSHLLFILMVFWTLLAQRNLKKTSLATLIACIPGFIYLLRGGRLGGYDAVFLFASLSLSWIFIIVIHALRSKFTKENWLFGLFLGVVPQLIVLPLLIILPFLGLAAYLPLILLYCFAAIAPIISLILLFVSLRKSKTTPSS
jgi:hypothetical protein